MSNEPKLPTESEWRAHYAMFDVSDVHINTIIEGHSKRGLIAPEPDSLRDAVVTANRAAMQELHFADTCAEPTWLAAFVKHLRALGVEIEREKRPVLTREIFDRASKIAFDEWMAAGAGPEFIGLMFTALQEQLK